MSEQTPNEHPIEELRRILDDAGADVAKLFGSALTLCAGALSATRDDKQKRAERERLIMGNRGH